MCRKLFLFLLFLLSAFLPAVLQAEDHGPWYLISEIELRSIEQYREKSELEKASWLSQVQLLSTRAERLVAESESLNSQLSQARDQSRKLEQSFNEFESDASRIISQQNMHIGYLETKNEKLTGQLRTLWAIIIGAGVVVIIILGIKVMRLFKVLPF